MHHRLGLLAIEEPLSRIFMHSNVMSGLGVEFAREIHSVIPLERNRHGEFIMREQ